MPPDRSGRRSISFPRGWSGRRAGPRRPAGSSSRSRRARRGRRPRSAGGGWGRGDWGGGERTGGGAGPFAMFSSLRLGGDPFEMLNAPSSGETAHCSQEKEKLWETIRGAPWSKGDAEKVRRAERLPLLGLVQFWTLEAG